MKNYKELKVWQKGMEIVVEVYQLTALLPKDEVYGLRSQITRAAVSIPSNIAEGSSRDSNKDYRRFLELALGSSFELETQILILERINLISGDKLQKVVALLKEEQMMLQGFIKRIAAAS
jgi:four helix bundle protein